MGPALQLPTVQGAHVGTGAGEAGVLPGEVGQGRAVGGVEQQAEPAGLGVEDLDPPGPAGVGPAVGADRAHDQRAAPLEEGGQLVGEHGSGGHRVEVRKF